MGFREMLAKANWELNTFMKTGKMTAQQNRQVPATPNLNQYHNQHMNNYQTRQATVMNGTPCPSCGTQVSVTAQFCHRCGGKTS